MSKCKCWPYVWTNRLHVLQIPLLMVEPEVVNVSVVDTVVAMLSPHTPAHCKLTKRKLKLFLVRFAFGVEHCHSERLNAVAGFAPVGRLG
jgi:hypothetical protein